MALTLYEDSLCDRCGHPRDRAYNPDMEGWFSARVHHCQACAVLEQDARDASEKGTEPGRKVGVADDAWDAGYVPSVDLLVRAIRTATGN